ncbi:DNA-processing protein DprA [Jeotgalibacillus soli]|uniref:Smf/DprA SLOG domain-containing protein n=1 Tax=Jeotgalibacillus soli TaxID=889306 RepID=A0A0C2VLJ5_9BACL|nr:DNA-processing protein DprA [Jeotgalibacillus soli]KIL44873.1 hypothetical protein KP78_24170 [Jeotgalibacillus soli]
MTNIERRDLLLHLQFGQILSNNQICQWLQHDPEFNFWRRIRPPFWPPGMKMTAQQHSRLLAYHHSLSSVDLLEKLEKQNISILTILDTNYPTHLKEIYDPPVILYAKGDLTKLESSHFLAVVGARKSNDYTHYSLNLVIPALLVHNICIVSGMAVGADGEAHKIAMSGNTIGVLGGGFDHLYPKTHAKLYHEMIKHQLLLSEYPPHINPQKYYFPMRNRIIAGLSRGVLITQAAIRSGSMITVDRALEEGRDIFAIPGPIHDELSQGTNELIKHGAKLVAHPKDILEEWGL